MGDITVKEVRRLKRIMDGSILAAIESFENDTGAHVTGLGLEAAQIIGGEPVVVRVDTEVQL